MLLAKKNITRFIFILISALISALSISIFVESGNLFPGGFAGISMLIVRVANDYFSIKLSFGVLYLLLQIVPTIIVYRYVGKQFTIFSVLQYTMVSLFTTLIPTITITEDILLIAVFGGIISGFAVSMALKQDASSGGTDFIAIYFANKYNISTWNYVMILNAGILCIAGVIFGWTTALYSIIYQFCNIQMVNLVHDRYKLSTLMIISDHSDEVKKAIFNACRHGITIIDGEGGYSQREKKVLFMTINTYEMNGVVEAIKEVDKDVFINIYKSERIIGNYRQKPLE
jgi:Uncharacterized conserved protein